MEKRFRRVLFLVHRWLGIAGCLLMLMWFTSGVVMMYVPYPSITPQERRAGLAPLAFNAVRVQPPDALAKVRTATFPASFRLEMQGARPVYRIEWPDRRRQAVWADTGNLVEAVGALKARALAAAFTRLPAGSAVLIVRDQWTVAQGFDPHRPLWRIEMNDAAHTRVHIAAGSGEIVQHSTAWERGWNWVGAIPHWLYLTAIRQHPEFWRQLVMWTSGPLLLVGISGVWIGILRLVRRGRWQSPYRGWMWWHHWLGLIGGLTLLTWVASGWLSVKPFGWFERGGDHAVETAFRAVPDAGYFPRIDLFTVSRALPDVRELRFDYFAGKPVIRAWSGPQKQVLLKPTGLPSLLTSQHAIMAATTAMQPHRIETSVLIKEPDTYWYGRWQPRPLPVWRMVFSDPNRTWLHIDATTGELLGQSTQDARTYRWLFSFLHDFDLPVLLAHRSVRDPVMWVLLGLGTALSASSIVIGWRRMTRPRRALNPYRVQAHRQFAE